MFLINILNWWLIAGTVVCGVSYALASIVAKIANVEAHLTRANGGELRFIDVVVAVAAWPVIAISMIVWILNGIRRTNHNE